MMLVMKQSIITSYFHYYHNNKIPVIVTMHWGPTVSQAHWHIPYIPNYIDTYENLQVTKYYLHFENDMCLTKFNAVSHRAWSENLRQLNKTKTNKL